MAYHTRIMLDKMLLVILILFCLRCQSIFADGSQQKSSLTFVIDDTMSMRDDIDQVRAAAKLIFNSVLESKASRIGNYVLVRFNDPDIKPTLVTTKREEYIQALDDIVLSGNVDCPEMALKGIEEGLIKSLPRSYIFVFTDASAKDYKDFPRIKSIAQEKSSQIIFVLTGLCSSEEDPDYVVYHDLAKVTSGQVFRLEKSEINKILRYVAEIVKAPRTLIAESEFRPGYDNTLVFIADGKTQDIIVAVSGKSPKVKVLDASGAEAKTKIILETANIVVLMITDAKLGKNTVIVGSLSNTKVIITGATTFDFVYGFSYSIPASIKDTEKRVIAGESSYLAIEIDNPDQDVDVKEVNLLDMDNNVLKVLPLHQVDRDFYVTDPTIPPNKMFKILVKGFLKDTKIPVQRISATPTEPYYPTFISGPPKIKETATKVEIRRYESIHITCKVIEGSPQPKMRWFYKQHDTSDFSLISETSEVLHIPAADFDRSGTYRCEAYNAHGSATLDVTVIILSPPTIEEDETTITTESGKTIDLNCAVSGFPPPKVSWSLNGGIVDTTHMRFVKTSTLRVKASLENAGKYTCEAVNALGSAKRTIEVIVTEAPKIKSPAETTLEKIVGCPLTLSCQASGFPKPTIKWMYHHDDTIEQVLGPIDDSGSLHIPELKTSENGSYVCEAENPHGSAKLTYTVKVLSPPSIQKSPEIEVVRIDGAIGVELLCQATGNPKPIITWTKNGVYVPTGTDCYGDNVFSIKNESTLVIGKMNENTRGTYMCIAMNKVGVDVASSNVVVGYYT